MSILLGVVTGVLTNLATDKGGVVVISALAVVVAIAVVLNYLIEGAPRPGVSQVAIRGEIRNTRIKARGDARVADRATGGGVIEGGTVAATDSDVSRVARDGGTITDSDVSAEL
jgi:hypothetical protein